MGSSLNIWLAGALLAVGCSIARVPAGAGDLPGASRGTSAAPSAPVAAEDVVACDSRDGALSVPLGHRCLPVTVSPQDAAPPMYDTERLLDPPPACGDVLRIEERTVRHVYSVLEIHAGAERLVLRDPAPATYQALLSPACDAAWFWEPGGGWLFTKEEGTWARRWFGDLGAAVSAAFSPDGRTLLTAGTDPGHPARGEPLLLLCPIDTKDGALGACRRIPAAGGWLSEVAVSTAGAFVQLSVAAVKDGHLAESSRLFGFSADGLSLEAPGDPGHASHARLIASGGARPLLLVVAEFAGTWVYDPRDLKLLARWPEVGHSGNAYTAGASPSPDGAYVAIPEPYRSGVTFIRSRDLRWLARLHGDELTGAGRILWRDEAVVVETFPLPYE